MRVLLTACGVYGYGACIDTPVVGEDANNTTESLQNSCSPVTLAGDPAVKKGKAHAAVQQTSQSKAGI
jgi:hypothetical protein